MRLFKSNSAYRSGKSNFQPEAEEGGEEGRGEENIPLLHTVETLEGWDGDKDDNSLLAVANFDLFKDQKSACDLHVCCRKRNNGPQPVRFRNSNDFARALAPAEHQKPLFSFEKKSQSMQTS